MKITIDVPQKVIDSFCSQHGYQLAQPDDGGEVVPETQAEFFERKLIESIDSAAMTWDVNQAADLARQKVIDEFVKIPKGGSA